MPLDPGYLLGGLVVEISITFMSVLTFSPVCQPYIVHLQVVRGQCSPGVRLYDELPEGHLLVQGIGLTCIVRVMWFSWLSQKFHEFFLVSWKLYIRYLLSVSCSIILSLRSATLMQYRKSIGWFHFNVNSETNANIVSGRRSVPVRIFQLGLIPVTHTCY